MKTLYIISFENAFFEDNLEYCLVDAGSAKEAKALSYDFMHKTQFSHAVLTYDGFISDDEVAFEVIDIGVFDEDHEEWSTYLKNPSLFPKID